MNEDDGGEALVRTIATALVLLSQRQAPGDPVYEDGVQRAFNQLVLRCLRSGIEPPASVPELVSWAARTPLDQWPAGFTEAARAGTGTDFLVDEQTRTPTQACLELALTVADAPAELFETDIIESALAACRSARSPASYTAFRNLLITRPVLTATRLAALAADIDLLPVFDTVRRSYEPAPAAYRRRDSYQLCGRCGCLLVPLKTGGYRCELERCRSDGRSALGPELPAQAGVLQLKRPLRVFVTSPGIAETDLDATLRSVGLDPQLWPEFDAYDLCVPFPSGIVWAVDVKDWANPALLARATQPLRAEPRHDRAFIVVPEYRVRVREDYARVFRHHLTPELADRIEICSDAEFTSMARRELRRARRGVNARA